jgi:hypothetical protein
MDAVRAADHDLRLVPKSLALQHGQESVDSFENQVQRLGHLDGQRGIDDVR